MLASAAIKTQSIPLRQYDDCELLWAQYGRAQLSLRKGAILRTLQAVQRGRLPCDAELLRDRAAAFARLQHHSVSGGGSLDALWVLNSSTGHALQHDPQHVQRSLQQLLRLLPGAPPTQLLLDTLADLDLPPEILALQRQEADAAFRACLGAHVTSKALHHLLKRWRQQQQQHGQEEAAVPPPVPPGNTQQRQWPVSSRHMTATAQTAAVQQQPQPQQPRIQQQKEARPLQQQLRDLAEVLGPEVVHAAVGSHPGLLDAAPSAVLGNVRWLQQQLQLSPVAAVLLAETAGHVLLLPSRVLEARYNNLCYLLLQLMGWRLRQVHTLLCNAPQLLGYESAQLASRWQLVQQAARTRHAWLEELAGASQALVVAVLCAEQHQLQQLQYAAAARELLGQGLVQVLRKEYVDFLFVCPGFRLWRAEAGSSSAAEKQPRWSLVEAGCLVVPDQHGGVAAGIPGEVLAVDGRGQPVLVHLGAVALGPGDALVAG